MSVEQRKVIDVVHIRPSDGRVVLTISDHLPWLSDNEHLLTLQDKINDYLACIESGEIFESYPGSRGKEIEIQVVPKFAPDGEAIRFLEIVGEKIRETGYHFSTATLEDVQRGDV